MYHTHRLERHTDIHAHTPHTLCNLTLDPKPSEVCVIYETDEKYFFSLI